MIGPVRKPLTGLRINTGTDLLTEMVGTARTIIAPTMQETTAGTLHTVRRFRPNRVTGGGSSGLDLSLCRLGYSISGTTCTLMAGAINFYGKQQVSVAQATFTLAGLQFAYVHHVRGSGAAAWATAGAEPGVGSTTDLDVTCYKFLNGAISIIYRIGDINFDLPLA